MAPASSERWLAELDDGTYAVIEPVSGWAAPVDAKQATPLALDPAATTVLARDAADGLWAIDVASGGRQSLGVQGDVASFDRVGAITVRTPGTGPCQAGGSVSRGPLAGPLVPLAPLQGEFFSRRFAVNPGGWLTAWSRELTVTCDPTASRVYVSDSARGTVTPLLDSDDGQHESVVGALADGTGFLVQRSKTGAAPFTISRVLWSDLSSKVLYDSLPTSVASGDGCDTGAFTSAKGGFICGGDGGLWRLDANGAAPQPITAASVGGRSVKRVVDVVTLEPSTPPEVCNFVDDDGDGSVDEGFDWQLSPFSTLLTVALGINVHEAITLKDGSVVIAGTDSYGEGTDKGWVVRVDASGAPLAGPTYVPIPLSGGLGGSLLERADDVVVAWNSTDYAGCKAGCPVVLRTLDKQTLAIKSSGTTLASAQVVSCQSLSLHQGEVLMGCHKYDPAGAASLLVRLDPSLSTATRVAQPSLAVGEGGGLWVWGAGTVAHYVTLGGSGTPAHHGAFDLGGPAMGGVETVTPQSLGEISVELLFRWQSGPGLVTRRTKTTQTELRFVGDDGAPLPSVPALADPQYQAALDIGGNVLWWSTVTNGPTGGSVRRVRPDGRAVPSPAGTVAGVGGYGLAMARVADGVLMLRGRGYLDRHAEVAKLTCAP